ncbi:MAG: binding-protein-dependent transport system inner rane component [Eubacterium sp.]|nr:binding-protein-dependent transport system inner rane component [Eubacterium sp.]
MVKPFRLPKKRVIYMNRSNLYSNTHKKKLIKNDLAAYAFLSPWIIGFVLFSGFPILYSLFISFTDWSLLGTKNFVFLDNYISLFQSKSFWNSLYVTLLFSIFSVIITIIWSFSLALLLNLNLRFNSFFQFIYFIPAVVPTVALAFAFQLMFNKDSGIINYLLGVVGFTASPNWLYDPKLVYPTVFFIALFTYSTGQMLLIFKSGLKEVPSELYEACEIDGANTFKKFLYVTLPAMSPVILFNMVMATIAALNNSFSLLYPLTGGGPNEATNVLSLEIYNQTFKNFKIGYGSALSVILFLIAAVFASIQFKLSNKWVHYDS